MEETKASLEGGFRSQAEQEVGKRIEGVFNRCPDSIEIKLQNFPKYIRRQNLTRLLALYDLFKKRWDYHEDCTVIFQANIDIQILKGQGYRRNISVGRFVDHRKIARKFRLMAPKQSRPDVIVAAMPSYDLAHEAVKYARKIKIPILIDIRDQWPDIFLDPIPPVLRPVCRALLASEYRMLANTLRHADGLIAMMDHLLRWGLNYAGREQRRTDRVFYLGYPDQRETTPESPMENEYRQRLDGRFVVLFVGTFGKYHNPSVVIEAAKQLKRENVCFLLAGDGEHRREMVDGARDLPNVLFPGWVDQNGFDALLKVAHIGLCPANRESYFLPNKAFAYLSAGLPILSAFNGDLKEIIEKEEIGFFFPPNDANALVSAIRKLKGDDGLYNRFSGNAIEAFRNHFVADQIYEDYVLHVERLKEKASEN